jgi:hypothetical protein
MEKQQLRALLAPERCPVCHADEPAECEPVAHGVAEFEGETTR